MKQKNNLGFELILATALLLGSLGFLEGQTAVPPAVGNGTEGNPYQIASLDNLYWITASNAVVPTPNQAARWSSHFLSNDHARTS